MAKVVFEGNVFADLLEKLEKLGGDVDKAIEKSLEEAQEVVAENAEKAMQKHHRTGKTEKQIIKTEKVEKNGTMASIKVGFNLPEGLNSIFLMYGTPRIKPDRKLYNAIYGKKTRQQIMEKQDELIRKAIKKRMEG